MRRHFKHVQAEEREVIGLRRSMGATIRQIAAELHRDETTIRRELRRNTVGGVYLATQAQKLSEKRRRAGRARCRKMCRPENIRYVTERLKKCWSPDQIAGRSKREFPGDRHHQFSQQLLYSWVKQHDHGWPLRQYFRRFRRRRHWLTRPHHQGASGIANRPQIVDARGRDGDWEGDTLMGPGSHLLVSMVERRSGYLVLLPAPARKARPVRQAMCGRLTQFPKAMRRSATFDNGQEFLETAALEHALGLDVYYCRPSSPWQRGSIENLNGLIRQFVPKGTNLSELSRYRIAQIEHLLNDRPRRRLGYQTPNEYFQQQCQRAIET